MSGEFFVRENNVNMGIGAVVCKNTVVPGRKETDQFAIDVLTLNLDCSLQVLGVR